MVRSDINAQIDAAISYQQLKWGKRDYTPVEWISILGEEFGEAAKEANHVYFDNQSYEKYVHEVAQVIAVGIQMLRAVEQIPLFDESAEGKN